MVVSGRSAMFVVVAPQALTRDETMDADAITDRVLKMFASIVLQLACLHAYGIVHVSGAVAAPPNAWTTSLCSLKRGISGAQAT